MKNIIIIFFLFGRFAFGQETPKKIEMSLNDFFLPTTKLAAKVEELEELQSDLNKKVKDILKGIPHKIVIDSSGYIKFKSVGFIGGTDHLVEELSQMIELSK